MYSVQFTINDDLIDICHDNVFKAVFTKDTPASRGALQHLIGANLNEKVCVEAIGQNEPPINNLNDRQIRFDVSVAFADKRKANVEMTMFPSSVEFLRMEYYAARLHVSQEIRGRDLSFDNLTQTYQISFLGNHRFWDDDTLVHHFKFHDNEHNTDLNGRMTIVTVELVKVAQIVQKPVTQMNSMERWAVFLVYCKDKSKIDIINEILQIEEGIAMAGDVMIHISRDEIERCRLESEYKYELDLQSATVEARRAEDRKWQIKYNNLQQQAKMERQQADAKVKQAEINIKQVQQQANAELRQAEIRWQQRIAELEAQLARKNGTL
jgi:hypothetical protein